MTYSEMMEMQRKERSALGRVEINSPENMMLIFKHQEQKASAIASDKTGDGFIFQMFDCELINHEYHVHEDVMPTLLDLDLTKAEVDADPALKNGLQKAIAAQEERMKRMMWG